MSSPQPRTVGPAASSRVARRAIVLALALLPLAACGRRGRPDYPEDVDPKFPRVYPVLPQDRSDVDPKPPRVRPTR